MRRACSVLFCSVFVATSAAHARNSDEVIAGPDVAMTGGVVVANVHSGAALWYNPAGVARLSKATVGLTGITMSMQFLKAPGLLSLDSGEQSSGKSFNLAVIPAALTFTMAPSDKFRLGFGLFNSSLRRFFLQDSVLSSPGAGQDARWVGATNGRVNFFHISSGFAGKLAGEKLQLGGAFDIVIGNQRDDFLLSGLYDDGTSGIYSEDGIAELLGVGFQLKAGLQWAPIEQVRIGLSVAAPTYFFMLSEKRSASLSEGPPTMGSSISNKGVEGGWFGAEAGNMRVGIAYVGSWGWIEFDLVVDFRLETARLGIDRKTVPNGRIGSIFRVSKHMQLGAGLFSDKSPWDTPTNFGESQIRFFGVNAGIKYSSKDELAEETQRAADQAAGEPPAEGEGSSFTIAVGARYAHGRGDVLGLLLPATYDGSPLAVGLTTVQAKANSLDLNFAVNVHF